MTMDRTLSYKGHVTKMAEKQKLLSVQAGQYNMGY